MKRHDAVPTTNETPAVHGLQGLCVHVEACLTREARRLPQCVRRPRAELAWRLQASTPSVAILANSLRSPTLESLRRQRTFVMIE